MNKSTRNTQETKPPFCPFLTRKCEERRYIEWLTQIERLSFVEPVNEEINPQKHSPEPTKTLSNSRDKYLKNCHTFCTSVELHSHRDVSIPTPRSNLNKPRLDGRVESVLYHCILVSVTCEVLKRNNTLLPMTAVNICCIAYPEFNLSTKKASFNWTLVCMNRFSVRITQRILICFFEALQEKHFISYTGKPLLVTCTFTILVQLLGKRSTNLFHAHQTLQQTHVLIQCAKVVN